MSNYSNFVGYVPDKLRLITSGGSLVQGELGLPNEYIASLAFGPVSTGNPVSGPGLGLNAAATFVIESGASYIDFQNLSATTNSITLTGEGEGGGTDFEGNFSSLEYVGNQITGRSDRLKKLNLPALKRVDSLNSTGNVALYYSGGNDVTGEVYSPNLTQAAGLGVYINYGSGGLNNIDNTFSSFVSGNVSVFGFTGYASGNATITPHTDFLSGMKAGDVYFEAPFNYQEIKIAQNNSGIGNIQSYSINAHQNTTGIVVPRIGNSSTRIRISGASTATGDLTVHFTGTPISTTGYARIFSDVPPYINTNLNNAYTGIHQTALGRTLNVINDHIHLISYYGSYQTALNNRFCGVQSSGDLNFSGNCLTGLTVDWTANDGAGANNFLFRSNNNLNFSTTGSIFNGWGTTPTGGNTRGYVPVSFQSISGNVNATFLNATQANGTFTLQLYSSGTTGVLSFPELTGNPDNTEKPSYVPTGNVPFFGLTISPGSGNAVNTTQILNIPKLHNISGSLTVQGLSGSTTTISGADLSNVSGILSVASSGNAYFTFTGGPGSGSGSIRNGVQLTGYLPSTTISGNLGSVASISGLNLTTVSGSTISLTATGLQTISGNLALNTSGNIFITGSSVLFVQSGIFVTGLSNNTININGSLIPGTTTVLDSVSSVISITGGHTGAATGVLSSNFLVTNRTSSAVITGIFNGIQTITGNFIVNSSGNTDLQLTGLNRIVSGVFVTGFTNTIKINSSLVPGTTAVIDSVSGTISITGGHTGPATGAMSSGFFITGRTSDAAITGIFNGIQTISGNLNLSSSGNTNIQLTGLTTIQGSVSIRSLAAATFTHPLDNNSSLTAISTLYTGYLEYYIPITITGNAITGVSASALAKVGNISGLAGIYGGYIKSTGMTNFSMPNITGWHTQTEFDLPNVTGFNMSGLVYLGGTGTYGSGSYNTAGNPWQGFWLKLGSTLTGTLNFSNLTDIHYYSANGSNPFGAGYFAVNPMRIYATGVTSIDMSAIVSGVYKPSWRAVDSVLIPSETSTTEFTCPALTGLTFGASGTTQRLIMNFKASGCPLNEASVDSILETFASLDGTAGTSTYSGLTITLNGLCAPPSATGSGYRDTLTGAGRNCTILINV